MGETQPAREAGTVTTQVPVRGVGVASLMIAGLGALGLALVAAWLPLTYLTGDLQASRDGAAFVFALACGLLGMLVARRQPQNPEGWLLLGGAVCAMAVLDSGLYAVLDYRLHHGQLPLGEIAVLLRGAIGTPLIFVFALVILLFPDGQADPAVDMGAVGVSGPCGGGHGGLCRQQGRHHRRAAHPGQRERGVLGTGRPVRLRYGLSSRATPGQI